MKRNRAVHGMGLGLARAAFFQQIRFESEIPFGWAVRVVDKHEAGIVFESFGLPDHRLLILAQECFGEAPENKYGKGHIPRGDKIDAAKIAPNGSNGGAAGKPEFASLDDFGAHVRQHKVDSGGDGSAGHFFEQLIGRAVGARRMGTHAKAIGNRLEFLLFFVNAPPAPPKPRLMYERTVRRVHQSDNSVVHMRRQIAKKLCALVLRAKPLGAVM